MKPEKEKLLKRLLSRRIITETNCWLYKGPSGLIKKEIYVNNRNQLVHRISAHIYLNFNLSDNHLICHKCKTKSCWNPDHIYVGNTSSNTLDSVRDKTFRNPNTDKEFCINGHSLSGSNLYKWKDSKNGQIHRWCRICRNNAAIKHKISHSNYASFKKVKL